VHALNADDAMHREVLAISEIRRDEDAKIDQLTQANRLLMSQLSRGHGSSVKSGYAALSPADRQSLDEVKNDEGRLDARLSALEAALMTTPEKAIAVPMLKEQVDTLQDRTRSDLDNIRGEIARLFTLTQWFIGLMFTIALGVFGIAIGSLRRDSPRRERSAQSEV